MKLNNCLKVAADAAKTARKKILSSPLAKIAVQFKDNVNDPALELTRHQRK